jgi:UDP-N-acetyl-D-mannosaminuronic acid dehydrogenase
MPHLKINLLDDALSEVGCQIPGSRILVMGYAYLEDSDDTRNNPSAVLVKRLHEMDTQVIIHDPYVWGYLGDLMEMAHDCDVGAVIVRHTGYRELDFAELNQVMRTPVFIDGRSIFTLSQLAVVGFTYLILGEAAWKFFPL